MSGFALSDGAYRRLPFAGWMSQDVSEVVQAALDEEPSAVSGWSASSARSSSRVGHISLGSVKGAGAFGALLYARGDQQAEAVLREADAGGDAVGAVSLGRLLADRGELDEAEAAWRRADERGDLNGIFNLGQLLRRRGRLDEAEGVLRRAERGGSRRAANALGMLFVERKALADAEDAFRRADAKGNAGGSFRISARC